MDRLYKDKKPVDQNYSKTTAATNKQAGSTITDSSKSIFFSHRNNQKTTL